MTVRARITRDEVEALLAQRLNLDSWITSDQHWGHRNIGKLQQRPVDHMALMESLWRLTVGDNDTVFHLGDLVVYAGEQSAGVECVDDLPGEKLLMLGNHDRMRKGWYAEKGFTLLGRGPFSWMSPSGVRVLFSHEPVGKMTPAGHFPEDWDQGWDVNIHGHIHRWTKPDAARYRNVSVERCGYAPVRLGDVLADGWTGSYVPASL